MFPDSHHIDWIEDYTYFCHTAEIARKEERTLDPVVGQLAIEKRTPHSSLIIPIFPPLSYHTTMYASPLKKILLPKCILLMVTLPEALCLKSELSCWLL